MPKTPEEIRDAPLPGLSRPAPGDAAGPDPDAAAREQRMRILEAARKAAEDDPILANTLRFTAATAAGVPPTVAAASAGINDDGTSTVDAPATPPLPSASSSSTAGTSATSAPSSGSADAAATDAAATDAAATDAAGIDAAAIDAAIDQAAADAAMAARRNAGQPEGHLAGIPRSS